MSELLAPPPMIEAKVPVGVNPTAISVDVPNTHVERLQHTSAEMNLFTAVEHVGVKNDGLDVDQGIVGVLLVDANNAVGILRVTHGNEQFLVLSKLEKNTDNSDKRAQLLSVVRPGEVSVVGRNDLDAANDTLSSKHFSVELDDSGEVKFTDTSVNSTDIVTFDRHEKSEKTIGPKGLGRFIRRSKGGATEDKQVDISEYISDINGWSVKSQVLLDAIAPEQQPESDWGYTQRPGDLIKLRGELKGYEEPFVDQHGVETPAKFEGRDVIKRDSKINKGVYIVPGIQEAIVVDDMPKATNETNWRPKKREYDKAYEHFKLKAKFRGVSVEHYVQQGQELATLTAAFESATEKLDYDKPMADAVSELYSDKKIDLEVFLNEGKGVCRHQALLAAYYIERSIDGGFMKGSVSVDRNSIEGRGGHAWARYTASDGTVYILDPAQQFVGTLEDSRSNGGWNYSRPEDK